MRQMTRKLSESAMKIALHRRKNNRKGRVFVEEAIKMKSGGNTNEMEKNHKEEHISIRVSRVTWIAIMTLKFHKGARSVEKIIADLVKDEVEKIENANLIMDVFSRTADKTERTAIGVKSSTDKKNKER
jgi:hypothetical protein